MGVFRLDNHSLPRVFGLASKSTELDYVPVTSLKLDFSFVRRKRLFAPPLLYTECRRNAQNVKKKIDPRLAVIRRGLKNRCFRLKKKILKKHCEILLLGKIRRFADVPPDV